MSRCWRSFGRAPRARRGAPGTGRACPARGGSDGIGASTVFVGERPADEIPAYLKAADALGAPRSRGKNTPLKIYQYLRSGKPIVATNLLTHTQVLDAAVAELTDPTSEAFGAGILRVLRDRDRAAAISRAARALATRATPYEAYVARTREALRPISERTPQQRRRERRALQLPPLCDPAMADRFDRCASAAPSHALADSQDQISRPSWPIEGRTVLDVGTGTGRAALGLARRGARVTGVDASARCCAWQTPGRRRPPPGLVRGGRAHRLAYPIARLTPP